MLLAWGKLPWPSPCEYLFTGCQTARGQAKDLLGLCFSWGQGWVGGREDGGIPGWAEMGVSSVLFSSLSFLYRAVTIFISPQTICELEFTPNPRLYTLNINRVRVYLFQLFLFFFFYLLSLSPSNYICYQHNKRTSLGGHCFSC